MFINDKKIMESEIAERNAHYFIYGRNTKERESFLKKIAEKHPFKFDIDEKCVVYIDDLGLPNVPKKEKDLKSFIIVRDAKNYVEFTVVHAILKKINEVTPRNEETIKKLIEKLNGFSNKKYTTLDEIIASMQEAKEFYATAYREYLTTGNDDFAKNNFSSLPMFCIFDISMYVREIQETTGNKCAFQVVLDRKEKIPKVSVMAINSLINLRCNGELSVKVVCEPDEWETMADLNGSFVEFIHDYSICELDDSFQESIAKRRKEFEERYDFERE